MYPQSLLTMALGLSFVVHGIPLEEKRQAPPSFPLTNGAYNVDCGETIEYSVGSHPIVYQPTAADQATTIQGKFDAFEAQAKSELNAFEAEVDSGLFAAKKGCAVCGEYGDCIHGVVRRGECGDAMNTNSGVYQPTPADEATTIQGKFDAFVAQAKSELNAFRAQVDAGISLNRRQFNDTDSNDSPPTVFTNVFNGYDATDAQIYDRMIPGVSPAPYSTDDFNSFRLACAEAARAYPASSGFLVTTNFQNNYCNLVTGGPVSKDISFATNSTSADVSSYLEAWNKLSSS
ncbi:hypothetical protein K440DRAFT_664087 [Wilcoxina mikolae CBS 423.85]|nr:hypothetical protein K440DRAFT_664087 [Wilcoxina mikolae CBS 423.85]